MWSCTMSSEVSTCERCWISCLLSAARTERAVQAQAARRGVALDEIRGRFQQSNKRCSFVLFQIKHVKDWRREKMQQQSPSPARCCSRVRCSTPEYKTWEEEGDDAPRIRKRCFCVRHQHVSRRAAFNQLQSVRAVLELCRNSSEKDVYKSRLSCGVVRKSIRAPDFSCVSYTIAFVAFIPVYSRLHFVLRI